MKRVAAILLILILTLQSFFQLGLITYFQLNREYIARVLCINKERDGSSSDGITMCGGKCFLEKNLKLIESTKQEEETPVTQLKIEIPVFVVCEFFARSVHRIENPVTHCTPYLAITLSGIALNIFHPPCQ